jgi:phosphatidylethanolamine-binding protein (PEBP) family uncharacterized protein
MRKKPTGGNIPVRNGLWAIAICIMAIAAAACLSADTAGQEGKVKSTQSGEQMGPVSPGQDAPPGQPPDQAVAACTGKSSGDACQFTERDGIVSGFCDEVPGILACAPERVPGNGRELTRHDSLTATDSTPVSMQALETPVAAVSGGTGNFTLKSTAGTDGGTMPVEYTCDGEGFSPPLSWSGAPRGTVEYALMLTTLPVDGSTRWNWVLYRIPGTATGLLENSTGGGVVGTGSHGTVMRYDPPCPNGPGAKTYTFTLYALSAPPALSGNPQEVTGPVLTEALSPITLGKASYTLSYARS